jgi:class 3 adenylate cyclase
MIETLAALAASVAAGDGVMIWTSDAGRAIALAAHAVEHVVSRGDLLPLRVGVHTGPAVMRGCDWYGRRSTSPPGWRPRRRQTRRS